MCRNSSAVMEEDSVPWCETSQSGTELQAGWFTGSTVLITKGPVI